MTTLNKRNVRIGLGLMTLAGLLGVGSMFVGSNADAATVMAPRFEVVEQAQVGPSR